MRAIKTLVLHLYVDGSEPERLCGDVRFLDEREGVPFKNFLELKNILLRFILKSTTAANYTTDTNRSD
jgi:hypothetical protein